MGILKNSKGQILPLVALTVLVLSMFSFLVWNLGILEFNRQKMQTAADAAALSAMRCRAAFYNAMSPLNASTHFATLYMNHNVKLGAMLKEQISIYQGIVTGLKALNQGAGGAPYLTAVRATKLNDSKASGFGSFVKGGSGTALKGRKMKFLIFKYVQIGKISMLVPWPPFKKTFNPAYYCRKWENSYRKAQPQQEFVWTVQKQNETFAASLIGLRRPANARAIAQAKVWLNVKENASGWFHNGGFPRNRSEGIYGWGLEPAALWPQFDARLVPVTRPPMLAH
ncbi:MAG: pilus assembly protein TadG-related protein [Elusimicrobiota bacterium]